MIRFINYDSIKSVKKIIIESLLFCSSSLLASYLISLIISHGSSYTYSIHNISLALLNIYISWLYKDGIFLLHSIIIALYWPIDLYSTLLFILQWIPNIQFVLLHRHRGNDSLLPSLLRYKHFYSYDNRLMSIPPSCLHASCFLNAMLYTIVMVIMCTYIAPMLPLFKILFISMSIYSSLTSQSSLPNFVSISLLFTNSFAMICLIIYNLLIVAVSRDSLINSFLLIKPIIGIFSYENLLKLYESYPFSLSKKVVLQNGINELFNIKESEIADFEIPIIAGETKYFIVQYSTIYYDQLKDPTLEVNHDHIFLRNVSRKIKPTSIFDLRYTHYYLIELRVSKASWYTIKIKFPRNVHCNKTLKCVPGKIDITKIKVSELIVNENNINVESESLLGRSLSVICTSQTLRFKLSFMDKYNNNIDMPISDVIKNIRIINDQKELVVYQEFYGAFIQVFVRNCRYITIYYDNHEISTISIFNVNLPFSIESRNEYIKATYHHIDINVLEYQKFIRDIKFGQRFIDKALKSKSSTVYLLFENYRIKVLKRSLFLFYKTEFHWDNFIHFRHVDKCYCIVGSYNDVILMSFNNESELQYVAYLISNMMESKNTNIQIKDSIAELQIAGASLNLVTKKGIKVDRRNIEKSKTEFEKIIENKVDIKVEFIGEIGLDVGGLSNEYFNLWNELLFKKETGIFAPFSNSYKSYHFVPDDSVETDIIRSMGGRANAAYFVGMYIGRLLVQFCCQKSKFVPLPCLLSRALRLHMLDIKPDTLCIQYDDIETWRDKFVYILENDPEPLDLTFDIDVIDPITQKHLYTKSLLDSPKKEIKLTEENKYAYLDLLADWMLNKSCEKQIKAFKKGFKKVIDLSSTSLNEKDLEIILCSMKEIDINDLIKHSYYDNCIQVTWLWDILKSFSKEEKSKFLQFVTGVSQLPMGSAKYLYPKLTIQVYSNGDTSRLPTSQTCFNKLLLPPYESYEELRKKLFQSIEDGSEGFNLV